MRSTQAFSLASANDEISSTKQLQSTRDVEQSAAAITRTALLVAYVATIVAFVAQASGVFTRAREFTVGAVLMSTTLFFYSDLIRVLLLREPRVAFVALAAGMELALIVLAIVSGMLASAAAVGWTIGGFLLLVPTCALIAIVGQADS